MSDALRSAADWQRLTSGHAGWAPVIDVSVGRAVSALCPREERCVLASTHSSTARGSDPIEPTLEPCSDAADTSLYARCRVVQSGSPRASADTLSGDLNVWPSHCRSMPQPSATSTTRHTPLTGVNVVDIERWSSRVGCPVRVPWAFVTLVQSVRGCVHRS